MRRAILPANTDKMPAAKVEDEEIKNEGGAMCVLAFPSAVVGLLNMHIREVRVTASFLHCGVVPNGQASSSSIDATLTMPNSCNFCPACGSFQHGARQSPLACLAITKTPRLCTTCIVHVPPLHVHTSAAEDKHVRPGASQYLMAPRNHGPTAIIETGLHAQLGAGVSL